MCDAFITLYVAQLSNAQCMRDACTTIASWPTAVPVLQVEFLRSEMNSEIIGLFDLAQMRECQLQQVCSLNKAEMCTARVVTLAIIWWICMLELLLIRWHPVAPQYWLPHAHPP
jgi:hypothetical protein